MSTSVPQPFVSTVNVVQPFRTKLEGIPSTYSVGVTDMPAIHGVLDSLPTIHGALDSLPTIRLSVDHLAPIEIRLTEIPSVRTHIPADFAWCFTLLGVDLGSIRFCGEAQIINEPYKPNPCESCGPITIRPPEPPVVGRAATTDTVAANRGG